MFESLYFELINKILGNGIKKENRTGIDTFSLFNVNYEIDVSTGFPLLTTRRMSFKNIVSELIWFLRGRTDIEFLHRYNNHIWDEWSTEAKWTSVSTDGYREHSAGKWVKGAGQVPAGYGKWWRRFPVSGNFETFDQIRFIVDTLRKDKTSRRLVVTAWEPFDASTNKIPPCHDMFIFNVEDDQLNLHLTQRSCDIGLGLPYNVCTYSLLLMIIAKITGLNPGRFAHSIIDAHIYENHVTTLQEQMKRDPFPHPNVEIMQSDKMYPWDYDVEDFILDNYCYHPAMKMEVAV
jgi:thymidylate synthase